MFQELWCAEQTYASALKVIDAFKEIDGLLDLSLPLYYEMYCDRIAEICFKEIFQKLYGRGVTPADKCSEFIVAVLPLMVYNDSQIGASFFFPFSLFNLSFILKIVTRIQIVLEKSKQMPQELDYLFMLHVECRRVLAMYSGSCNRFLILKEIMEKIEALAEQSLRYRNLWEYQQVSLMDMSFVCRDVYAASYLMVVIILSLSFHLGKLGIL